MSAPTEVVSSGMPALAAEVESDSSFLRPSELTASWALVDDIVHRWQLGQPPDTRAALTEFPHLELNKRIVIELAYEEFCQRQKAGEAIDLEGFCSRFPEHRDPLHRLLRSHLAAEPRLRAKPLAPFRWPKPGEKLEQYYLLAQLGRGTFAVVYLAYDINTRRQTVVKASIRGEAEAKLIGPLEHDAIVPIWSAFTSATGFSLVSMPFLGLATLQDLLDESKKAPGAKPTVAAVLGRIHSQPCWQGRLPTAASFLPEVKDGWSEGVSFLALHLARGLEYLHRQNVRHGDLKPSNILLRWDGRPVILDFNLAEDTRLDSPRFGGTLPYMAPELIRATLAKTNDRPKVDEKADVYSLGVICFELLSGQHPFGAPPKDDFREHEARHGASQWLLARQQSGYRPPRELAPALDPALARLIGQCLRLDPSQRPTAGELANGLHRLRRRPHRLAFWLRRHPVRVTAASALALTAILATSIAMARQDPIEVREMSRGLNALADGQPAQAEAYFDHVLKIQPENAQAYFSRGTARLRQNDVDSAMRDFQRASEIQPDGRTLTCFAYCLTRSQNHPTAIAKADLAEKTGYRSAAMFNNRGVSHLRERMRTRDAQVALQKLEQARQDFQEAIQRDPKQQAPYYNRAMVEFTWWGTKKVPAYLVKAQEDILRAWEIGPLTGKLAMDGATILAASKFVDQDRIIALLRQAAGDGFDPARFVKNPYLEELKANPQFQQLVLQKPAKAPSTPPADLIDPSLE